MLSVLWDWILRLFWAIRNGGRRVKAGEGLVKTSEDEKKLKAIRNYLYYLRNFHKGDGDVIWTDFKAKTRRHSREELEFFDRIRKEKETHDKS
jgi:hypothetical protein